MSALIYTDNVSFSYGTQQVLDGINVTIPRDKITAIIGPNGSGKTSLLNCIAGFTKKYQGTISLDQKSLSELTAQQIARKIGYLHQHMPANLFLTVRQVVELGLIPRLKPWSINSRGDQQGIDLAIERVNLSDFEHRPFDSLSGGEKQRALIAKVMVQKPELLLLDEPTNHLDIKYQIEIMTLIRSLKMSVVCCIHDLNLAASYADYIICLDNGSVAFAGPREEVLTSENISAVYDVVCQVNQATAGQKYHIQFEMGDN